MGGVAVSCSQASCHGNDPKAGLNGILNGQKVLQFLGFGHVNHVEQNGLLASILGRHRAAKNPFHLFGLFIQTARVKSKFRLQGLNFSFIKKPAQASDAFHIIRVNSFIVTK